MVRNSNQEWELKRAEQLADGYKVTYYLELRCYVGNQQVLKAIKRGNFMGAQLRKYLAEMDGFGEK